MYCTYNITLWHLQGNTVALGMQKRVILYCRATYIRGCQQRTIYFNIHGSVHRNNILIYIQQDATLHSLLYLETALHVSGGTFTHH
jgi:hypothetical protein